MSDDTQPAVEEMFIIQTEEIEVIGSLIRETAQGFTSKGTVLFKDGTSWGFRSPRGERLDIKKRLVDMFEKTAAFYDTDVIYHRFLEDLSPDDLYDPGQGKPRLMN